MSNRVVITGASALTPIGHTEEQIIRSLTTGQSGVKRLRQDDMLAGLLASQVFGTVDYPCPTTFDRRYTKTMGPVSHYGCHVAKQVIAQSGMSQEFLSSGRVGISFGSTQGSPTTAREVYRVLFAQSRPEMIRLNPAAYLQSMTHTVAANIGRMFAITGRTMASCTACTTGTQAIGFGYESVKYGMQDAMLCGAADEYDTTALAVFDQLLAASHEFNDTPHRTPRPFDKGRDGLVVGEGAAAVMLESLDHAKKRDANILGEVVGFACTNSGGDLVLPSRKAIEHTIRAGLADAKIAPETVDFLSAHATATKMGDIVEAEAIGGIYGNRPRVTGFKSYVGHTMAACGAMETVFTLCAMKRGLAFPTLNLEEVDERCAMARHVRQVEEARIGTASVQSFAFGGVNAVLFLRAFA